MKNPFEEQPVPLFVAQGPDAPRPELPFVERDAIVAIIRNPQTGQYLGLKWKKIDWETFVTGGIEPGQSAEEAARAEIAQETGYTNVRLISELPRFESKFYHGPKKENRHARFRSFLFELENETREGLSDEEAAKHEYVWLSPDELKAFRLPEGHRFIAGHI